MKNAIKFFSSAFLFFVAFSFSANAQTNVSGFINANTNWTVAGNPYIVTGNALVSQGYTLTIDAGVIVKFNLNTTLQVDGQLIAIGTAANRITFTSNQASPVAGDWGKLHIADNSIDAVYDANGNYLSGTILKYCDVLYGGGVGFGEVHIVSASPYISQCSVKYSKAAGIYCVGSTYILDSSFVSNNADYGLYFDKYFQNSCGLVLQGNTIQNNTNGGLYLGVSSRICSIDINNNYFIANSNNGAIFNYDYTYVTTNVKIRKNYFINNQVQKQDAAIINFYSGANQITIAENYFANNSGSFGIILFIEQVTNDSIKCNVFLNNTTLSGAAITMRRSGSYGIIDNNIFEGNINNSTNGKSVIQIESQGPGLLSFSNNIIRNNYTPNGSCCYFNAYLSTNNQLLRIERNEFSSNVSKYVIYLDGGVVTSSNYDFLYMKRNNFLDVSYQIELYNHIPFGSPNIHADSNYWGGTSTARIDSIIYDYFDTANFSVVYYTPLLTDEIVIDTTCGPAIPTFIINENHDRQSPTPFPNPFSTYSTITFKEELKDASLVMYNVFGQKVKTMEHINSNNIRIERQNLISGIYIYEVVQKHRRIANGKLVIE